MSVPAPPQLVPRDARSGEVARCLQTLACTAIVAPPGYGKTTLLALAIDRLAIPAVRYTVELWHAGDVIEPLVEAIRTERPDFGLRTLALSRRRPRAHDALETWSRQLGSTFASDLDHVREPLVIAIDDAHIVADDVVFAGFLAGALKALPSHAHVALAGRALPDLPMAEWIAAGQARLFSVDDVRFGESDIRSMADRFGREVGEDELAALASLYEGWAAGIALAFAAGDSAMPARSGSLPARSAYLVDANLKSLDADLVGFLEQTAVFETLDAGELEHVDEFSRARDYLAELERRGIMFEVIRPGERYRVHRLLREALLERVRRTGPQGLAAAHGRAAAILERAGRIREALFHYEASGDELALARFIGVHAYDSFIAGQGERIARIAKRLERNGVDAPAVFALVDGMIARQRGEPGAEVAFLRGIAAAAEGDPVGVACRMLFVEDRLARREPIAPEQFAQLSAVARTGGPLVELNVHVFTGWAQIIAGEFESARTQARRAAAIAGGDAVGRTRAASLDAYSAIGLGHFAEADAIMAATLRALEASEHVVLLANTLVWYARFALLWNDVAAARDYAERGRALAHELDLPAELAGVEIALAEIYARNGERARCESASRAAIRESAAAWYAGDRVRTRALAAVYCGRAAFAAGDVAAALACVRRALDEPGNAIASAQRAALDADAAAYCLLANDPQRTHAYESARTALQDADATDALDAANLSDAALVLTTIARQEEHPVIVEPSPKVRRTFGDYLTARAEVEGAAGGVEPLLRALRPAVRTHASANTLPRSAALTRREDEILHLIAQGLTNREIAQRFTLSPRTVETHVERVLSKLGANSRTRAVATAIRLGMVSAV